MSQPDFQSMLARMVADPEFRDRVNAEGDAALVGDLTPLERERLLAAAASRGLDAHRTLHKSFRLGKLYALLPLTCSLLGDDRFAEEVSAYWSANIPTSFYFYGEAIEFCDHLLNRIAEGLSLPHLAEIVSYERAALELGRPRPEGELPEPQMVRFDHDPALVIAAVAGGEEPGDLPREATTLIGSLDSEGVVQWFLAGDQSDTVN